MSAPFKKLLLIILMAVMPVQGFAAAAMIGCPASKQEAGIQRTSDEITEMASESMASCHETKGTDPASPGQTDCRHCTACYLASPLIIPNSVITPFSPACFSLISPADTSWSGFISDTPERPPRSTLA